MAARDDSSLRLPARFGRYTLDAKIGAGGMAEVYRGRLIGADGFEKPVCVKRILPHLAQAPDFAGMFRDEAAIAARIQHGNIVQIFDYGEERGSLYIAMELIEGVSLARLLQTYSQRGERLPVPAVLKIGVEMCKGLHHAHQATVDGRPLGVVHRDVTPHNILISKAGEVKVADFGVARADGRRTHTQTGIIKGKIQYMAPEQALGKKFDHHLDQFATGIVLWEALTGQRLFRGASEFIVLEAVTKAEVPRPSELRKDVPGRVSDIVLRALNKDPAKRFKDMGAFEEALAEQLFALAKSAAALDLRPIVQRCMDKSPPPSAVATVMVKAPRPPDIEDDPFDEAVVAETRTSGVWVKDGDTPQMGASALVNSDTKHKRPSQTPTVAVPMSGTRAPRPLFDRNTDGSIKDTTGGHQFSTVTIPLDPTAGRSSPTAKALLMLVGLGAVSAIGVGLFSVNADKKPVVRGADAGTAATECPARYARVGGRCHPEVHLTPNLDGLATSCGAEGQSSTAPPGAATVSVFARPGPSGAARVVIERTDPGVVVLAADEQVSWTLDTLLDAPPKEVFVIGDAATAVVTPKTTVTLLGRGPTALAELTQLLEQRGVGRPNSFASCFGGAEFLLTSATRRDPIGDASLMPAYGIADPRGITADCTDALPRVAVLGGPQARDVILLAATRTDGASQADRLQVIDDRSEPHVLVLGGEQPISWEVEVVGGSGLTQVIAVGGAGQTLHARGVAVTELDGTPGAGAVAWSDARIAQTFAAIKGAAGSDVSAYLGCSAARRFRVTSGPLTQEINGKAADPNVLAGVWRKHQSLSAQPAGACRRECEAANPPDTMRFVAGDAAVSAATARLAECERCARER